MQGIAKLIRFLLHSSESSSHSRSSVLLVTLTSIAAGVSSTFLLALINSALHDKDFSSRFDWVFLLLCLSLPLTRFASQMLLIRLAQGISYDLRRLLSQQILATPLRQLESKGAPRILATLTDDITTITNAMVDLPTILLHITVVLTCLVYLGWLSWPLLLVVIAFIVIGVGSYQIPALAAYKHFHSSRERRDDLMKQFLGLVNGIKELKIHRQRRISFARRLLEPTLSALRRHNVIGGNIFALANSLGQAQIFIVISLVIVVVPRFMTTSSEVVTGFALTILYMLTPLEVILNQVPIMNRAAVAVNKVENLGFSLDAELELEPEGLLPDGAEGLAPSWKRLELIDVTHTYYREVEDDNFTLGPINLTFEPSELVFLVGGNGSGKTTAAKLITGLYTPEKGEIRLDGRAIDDANRDDYRQLFSIVFSDFYLFDALIGIDERSLDERAGVYLEKLHLSTKVRVQDGVLSTTDLSQGQRKRLALLTAYLEDRPIYLFDEWAADQDPQFKSTFYELLLPELRRRGKTVLVISHDDHYFHLADRIIKLQNGRVELVESHSSDGSSRL